MNILLITNALYPHLNANSEIAYRLSRELTEKYSCEISILGFNRTQFDVTEPDFPVKTLCIPSMTKYSKIATIYSNRFLRVLHYLTDPEVFRCYLRDKIDDSQNLTKEFKAAFRCLLRQEKFDCVMGFMRPRQILITISQLNLKIPFIAYKLDPWSTHYQSIGDKEECAKEAIVDRKAAKIFVTDLIRQDYETYASEAILNKLVAVEFPNIVRQEEQSKLPEFKDGKIHCVFAGTLYQDIRNPKYTLELIRSLKDMGVVFHIVGYPKDGNLLHSPMPCNIICHGQVTSDEAMRYMQSADILVNIGNTILNQMPSKILTYISLGKPILNIIKSPNCPTLPYMAKYPLALNVLETPEVRQEDADRVSDFIKNNVGKRIPFEEIKEKYHTCTPEYVGKQLYDVICEVVEKHKEKAQKEQHGRKSV